MRKSIIFAIAALAVGATLADAKGTIITENGDTQKGLIRWSSRDKAYVVTNAKGIELQVKPADVAEIDIEKPAAFDAAVVQVQKGQGAAAVPVLKKIVSEYQHLQWDKMAGRYLAEALISSGKADEGLKACQAVIATDPTAAYKGDLAPAYWSALLSLNKIAPLKAALDKAAKTGDRFSTGAALTARGDLILKEGKESNDATKQALLDGYLRVVLLYRDAEIAAALRPEALYKAAACFEKLGMSSRADMMRRELKQDYAASPWASR